MKNPKSLEDYSTVERLTAKNLFDNIKGIKDYQFTTGNVCYDAMLTLQDDRQIIVELKVRSFEVKKYNSYILQASKLISLINMSKKLGTKYIYYINFFQHPTDPTSKDFIIFNLNKRIEEWKYIKPITRFMFMNDETWKSRENKIQKEVIMLEYRNDIDSKGTFKISA